MNSLNLKQSLDNSNFITKDDGIISGYASVFNVTDAYNDVVQKGAFANAINQFHLGNKPKLLWQHNINQPIGIIENMFEDDYGLFVQAKLLLDLPSVKDIYCLLKNKAINGFSIGYHVNKKSNKNGKQLLSDINLLEISIVTFPACEPAVVSNVKSKGNIMDKDIENMMNELNNNINNYLQSNNKNINIQKNIMPLSANTKNTTSIDNYIRNGINNLSTKSIHSSDDSGELLLPQELIEKIENQLAYLSPMRAISKNINVSGNSLDILVDAKAMDAGWSGKDNDPREETDTPELKKITIPVHEVYARPKASQQLLDDSKINVEKWLINKIAEKFAHLENIAFINGVGDDKPHGFLKYPSSKNENREFGILQHFSSGEKGKFKDNQSALNLLIDIACSIKPIYVKNAKWIMSRSALAEIRKIKNNDGITIWQPAISESAPATLLGYPVIIDDDMPPLKNGEASSSVAFGDFSAGYQIVNRQELSVLRDPYTSKPFVEFYATKRIGGGVIDFDAIKILKFDQD